MILHRGVFYLVICKGNNCPRLRFDQSKPQLLIPYFSLFISNNDLRSLFEISFQQSFEGFAVAGFITGHFVNGVMDGIKIEFLRQFGQFDLA